MIYNFHHFYYWLKGGVETGQAYRAKIFRELGLEAKFIFATTFPNHNIQHETAYLGFQDSEVIWMYGFFTDCRISPVTYTLEQLENTFEERNYTFSRDGKIVTYHFPDLGVYYTVYMTDEKRDLVHRVMMISNGCLVRQDYYTYCRNYSEYYIPVNGQAQMYLRRFFHEDGSVAYEEVTEGDSAFIQNAAPAKVGLVIHADHFWNYDEEHVLWYGIYEYAFAHPEKISFFITNTEAQNQLLREQFRKYTGKEPDIRTIPVVGLDGLKKPEKKRKKHA